MNFLSGFTVKESYLYHLDGSGTGYTVDQVERELTLAFQKSSRICSIWERVSNLIFGKFRSTKVWRNAEGKPAYVVTNFIEGGYGKIYRILDLTNHIAGVLKRSIDDASGKFIKNEIAILEEIHRINNGKVLGIQSMPKCSGVFKNKIGYCTQKASSDYFLDMDIYPNTKLEDRMSDFYQQLHGLKFLHENGILHGDLRPENILIFKEPGIRSVDIIDFGGAVNTKSFTGKLWDLIGGTYLRPAHPDYTLKSEEDKSIELAKQEKREDLIAHEMKRDVLAMGIILYNAARCCAEAMPEEILDIINDMLISDATYRSTAIASFYRLENYLERNFPELLKCR